MTIRHTGSFPRRDKVVYDKVAPMPLSPVAVETRGAIVMRDLLGQQLRTADRQIALAAEQHRREDWLRWCGHRDGISAALAAYEMAIRA